MSYNYPRGPPHHGYPPPPAPGYAYVQAPFVMPMPTYPAPHHPPVDPAYSQPTYVNNYYYPTTPAPEPVRVVENPAPTPTPPQPVPVDPIEWVPCTGSVASKYAHRAVVAGKEGWDSSPLWVIRAHHSGDLIPGKLAAKHRSAYIAYGGKEIPVHNFELLCAPIHVIRWVAAKNGQIPIGAIVAGNTHQGEPLYIGRAKYMKSLTPGKIQPSHGCLYMSFGGKEVPHKHYEVLCRIG